MTHLMRASEGQPRSPDVNHKRSCSFLSSEEVQIYKANIKSGRERRIWTDVSFNQIMNKEKSNRDLQREQF